MAFKAILAAAVPLTLLGLWLGSQRSEDAPLQPDPAGALGSNDEAPLLAPVDPGDEPLRQQLADGEKSPASSAPGGPVRGLAQGTEGTATPAPGETAFSGEVIDRLTGEPVPHLPLVIQTLKARIDEAHSSPWEAVSFTSKPPTDVTDAEGRFRTEETFAAGAMLVRAREPHGRNSPSDPQLEVQHPSQGPLEIAVGPTFFLSSAAPPACGWEALTATWIDPQSRGRHALVTQVRNGASPWVRFAPAVTELDGEGPWTLRFSDREGLHVGHVEVRRHVGIEPLPIQVDFDPFGAIHFVAPRPPGTLALMGTVTVTAVDSQESHTTYLDLDRAGENSVARIGELPPGIYRWSHGARSGEVGVVANEVAAVTLQSRATGDTFDAVVSIDATAAPEQDLSKSMFRLTSATDLLVGLAQFPERDPGGAEGMWLLRLDGLAAGAWNVLAPAGFTQLTYEPERITVAVDRVPDKMVVRPQVKPLPVNLHIVDRDTGEAIPSAQAAVSASHRAYSIHSADEDGTIVLLRVPPQRESEILVRAPGYGMRQLWMTPGVDGTRFKVELERGWSSVVRVIRTETLETVEGVEVILDGVPKGTTGPRGTLRVSGDEPPSSGTLGAGSEELVVTRSPFRPDVEPTFDPVVGFTFLVRGRTPGD